MNALLYFNVETDVLWCVCQYTMLIWQQTKLVLASKLFCSRYQLSFKSEDKKINVIFFLHSSNPWSSVWLHQLCSDERFVDFGIKLLGYVLLQYMQYTILFSTVLPRHPILIAQHILYSCITCFIAREETGSSGRKKRWLELKLEEERKGREARKATEWGQAHDRMEERNIQEFTVLQSQREKMWKEKKMTWNRESDVGKPNTLKTTQKIEMIWYEDGRGTRGEEHVVHKLKCMLVWQSCVTVRWISSHQNAKWQFPNITLKIHQRSRCCAVSSVFNHAQTK